MDRLALILPKASYRSNEFMIAADRLGIETLVITDADPTVVNQSTQTVHLSDLSDSNESVNQVARAAMEFRAGTILSVDDQGSKLASLAAESAGLRSIPLAALETTTDKAKMREVLSKSSSVRQPDFIILDVEQIDLQHIRNSAAELGGFPVIIKPTRLSGSRGVILINSDQDVAPSLELLLEAHRLFDPTAKEILVEQYISGTEYAVDGYIDALGPHILVIFDKPEPMQGPYFEESIYLMPADITNDQASRISGAVTEAVSHLDLVAGAFHAEVRIGNSGEIFIIEIAARSIGGKCSRSVRFSNGRSLEEMILASQLGIQLEGPSGREKSASGVLMLSTPMTGILRGVQGVQEAAGVRFVTEIDVTTPVGTYLRPVPLADRYLGFVFARGPGRSAVLGALREARALIQPVVDDSNTAMARVEACD